MSDELGLAWFTIKQSRSPHQFTGHNTEITESKASSFIASEQGVSQSGPRTLCYPVQIHFVAEGAANVIYELLPTYETDSLPKELEGKLLRVRKRASGIASTSECWHAYRTHFLPLLGRDHVLEYELVRIDDSMHKICQRELQRASEEGERQKYRKDVWLDQDDKFGLLMPNMKIPPSQGLSGDFKLKWLTQSRDAPPNAIRCRTCALAASRGKGLHVCPLQFASEKEEERVKAITNMVGNFVDSSIANPGDPALGLLERSAPDDKIRNRLVTFFSDHGRSLVLLLRKLQSEWDQTGVLNQNTDPNLPLAMTLRDCTLFLKIPNDDQEPVIARLGDLDIKSSNKVPEWRRKEKELIDGNWYTEKVSFNKPCLLLHEPAELQQMNT